MPRNPWLAIDTTTPPAVHARRVRREWERFVVGGATNGVLRAPVADSWQRSLAAGVDPSGSRLAPTAVDRAEAAIRWEAHPLVQAVPLIRECLKSISDESRHLLVLTDATGLLLQIHGDAQLRSRAADSMNFTEGALWSESGAGTNAIGTALAADHAVQIFATEHFVEVVQAWSCSAAPVHDPETGELLGVIDVTSLLKDTHPHSLAVVTATARAVESQLRSQLQERDDRLRTRYAGHLTGAGIRRALVTPTGRIMADDPRGWLLGAPVELRNGGGELILPSGARAIAEPVGHDDAFIVREVARIPARPRPTGDEVRALADEQAALRRLAIAVARGASPQDIFTAVAEEVAPLLGAEDAAVIRFESDDDATVVSGLGPWLEELTQSRRVQLDDFLAVTAVRRTGRSTRLDDPDYSSSAGPIADYVRRVGTRSAVASPIVVEGRLWGAVVVSTTREPFPPDTESRLADFAELVGIVIANAESRAELTASRARVLAAGDEARRRIQRDLHDGAQQRLVSAIITLMEAREHLDEAEPTDPVVKLVDEALEHAKDANGALRELAHGILPGALSRGGLRAGIDALVSRVRLPVSVEVTSERLPAALEATAYFIVAEALTNAVKHARATSAHIAAAIDGGVLRLAVSDDGVGGADCNGSSGLVGLRDRAAALGGALRVVSAPGEGTVIAATLPIPA
jgi:signal transduction histidine kinase